MDIEQYAKGLSAAQRRAILKTEGPGLLPSQSQRATLAGPLTDYSYRPARLSPLGLAVRDYLYTCNLTPHSTMQKKDM